MTGRQLPGAVLAAVLLGGAATLAPTAVSAQPGKGWGEAQDATGHDARLQDLAREALARGYIDGRLAAHSAASGQASGADARAPMPGDGGGRGDRHMVMVPGVLPDTPAYRGMQHFALMPVYTPSVDWLFTAAQSLREAVQAMAQQPPSDQRNEAMSRARQALIETQEAMLQLPPEMRTR
ncbi:hypothetical protein [Falsiroseomonas sp. HW251]|uniref:hypothetical protein n=1 Tax=Falsiroseomonas sp. HW251 TaxID=3390998 RepID=UPI003D310A2E